MLKAMQLDIDQNHQRTLCGDIDLDVDAKSRAPKVDTKVKGKASEILMLVLH